MQQLQNLNANRRRNCPGRSHPLEVHEAYKLAGQLAKAQQVHRCLRCDSARKWGGSRRALRAVQGAGQWLQAVHGVDQRLQAVHGLQDSCFSERSRFQTLRPNMTSKSGLCGRTLNQAWCFTRAVQAAVILKHLRPQSCSQTQHQ